MASRKTALLEGIGAAVLALAACSSGGGSKNSGGNSSGSTVSSIKLVAAEYSKDHTAAFWKQFADKHKAKTGTTLDVHRPGVV